MLATRCLGLIAILVIAACGGGPATPARSGGPAQLAQGSFTANLDGATIHYEVHGQGPVVMTLPNSWGLSLAGLRALYRPLEERLTMVYFDPRGLGGSSPVREDADMGMAAVRADFDALRRHLGLEKVNAIGWSNGAMNLILLAAERPESIDSAIFVHGAASFTEEDGKALAARYPGLMTRWAVLKEELADPSLGDEEKTAKLRAMWLDDYLPMATADPAGAPAMLHEVFRDAQFSWRHADYSEREAPIFDARPELGRITARCLVIAGAHDMFPPDKVRELADGLRDARFVVFEESGHFSPVEEPEGFRDAVFGFLGVGEGT